MNICLSKKLFIPKFYPYLFNYSKRYEVYYGGAGSGKSYFVAQKILIKSLNQQRKILVIRKVGRTLKDSVWQLIVDLLTKFRIYNICKINLSTLTIELPNGSILLFKGLDDPEKIKSITGITDIWLEEATELSLDDFTQLNLRLRAQQDKQQIFISFNPVSKINWCYKRWFQQEQPQDTMILQSTYLDNPFLPQDYITSLEQMINTNPTYYRIYALGEFCSLDQLVYSNWTVAALPDVSGLQCIIGLDFGYVNDPSALVVSYVDEAAKKIYVKETMYKKGLLNNEIADYIKYRHYQKEVIIADSAEQKSIEEIRRLGVPRIKPAAKGQGSILQGIQKLQQYELVIAPDLEEIVVELQNYSYKKDKVSGEYTNQPVDAYNHCLDALRYSIQALDNNNKVQSISKLGLGL